MLHIKGGPKGPSIFPIPSTGKQENIVLNFSTSKQELLGRT
jgi:hypothetical protein